MRPQIKDTSIDAELVGCVSRTVFNCIWTLPPGDFDFSVRWAKIKRFVTKQCGPAFQRDEWLTGSKLRRKESTIWQRRFWEHQIRDEHDFERHLDYIHYNPVKHGYAKRAKEWPYSTFHRYLQQGIYPQEWDVVPKEDPDGSFGEP